LGCVTVETPKGIHAVDTTGAGDIFGGSAMSQLLKTGKHPGELTAEELKDIVRFACCAASLSTQKQGGISSVPEEAEVRALVNTMA
jgi:fructokinase